MNRVRLLLLLAASLPASAESTSHTEPVRLIDPAVVVEFEARARLLFLRGTTTFDEDPAEGDDVRLGGDLGLDAAPAGSLKARVLYEGIGGELEIGGARAAGSGTLDRPRRWNESSFAAGDRVRTTLLLTTARLAFVWQPPDTNFVQVELLAGVRYDRLALRLNGDGDNLGMVAPEGGGRLLLHGGFHGDDFQVGFPGIDLDFRARIFGLPGRKASAFGWSASAGLRVQFTGWLRLELGYTLDSARFRRKDSIQHNRIEVTAHGPYLELTLNF